MDKYKMEKNTVQEKQIVIVLTSDDRKISDMLDQQD